MATNRDISYAGVATDGNYVGFISGTTLDSTTDKYLAVKMTTSTGYYELVGDGDEIFGSIIFIDDNPAGFTNQVITIKKSGTCQYAMTGTPTIGGRLVGEGSGYVKEGNAGEIAAVGFAPRVVQYDSTNDYVYANHEVS